MANNLRQTHEITTAASRFVNVAISGLSLNVPHSGTGRYARHVTEYLSSLEDIRACLLVDGDLPVDVDDRFLAPARVVKVPVPVLSRGSYAHKLLWEQAALSLAAARTGATVLYSPHFSIPLFSPCPSIVSIHDLIPLNDPLYAGGVSAKLYFRLVGAAARKAKAVITLSYFAKAEIERLLGIRGDRIHVVHPGVDAAFSDHGDMNGARRARARYNLPERFILYVGGSDARKNVGVLIEAAARLRHGSTMPTIVIAAALPKPGRTGLFPDWRAQAQRLSLGPERVLFIERIAEEDLHVIYREALGFAFPSRAEGFGLTPLEAMASGAPVICSNATSLPEAVGDAGIQIPPDDIEAWVIALSRISEDADLRARLSKAGMERARHFNWNDTGKRVADIIRTVGRCES